jgi:hypothetical protein
MARVLGYTACAKCGAQAEIRDDGTVACTRTKEAVAAAHALADKRRDEVLAACEAAKKNAGVACGHEEEKKTQ